jgi:hypothetical protein
MEAIEGALTAEATHGVFGCDDHNYLDSRACDLAP